MPELYNNRTPDDIVGKIPPWISGKGNIIMFSILCGIIILGFIIPYQECITASVMMSYDGEYNVTAYMESYGYGNVQKGQPVQIEIDAYPKNEFGYIHGEVSQIGSTLEEGKYIVKIKIISVPKKMKNCVCKFQEMTCNARVIIGDTTIIYRLIPILKNI